ncbi:MAG: tol-pal system protein YbgF [Elusimicrobia bacterium ADurb.Bin231]|nr:MAG: tol-pal system protein YbgF [Elusimicrobia bacterium ADurb.Bin231]
MKLLIIKKIFVIILLSSVVAISSGNTLKDIYQSGVEQFQQGRFREAADSFTVVLSSSPKVKPGKDIVIGARIYRADAMLELLELDGALKEYRYILNNYPKSSETMRARFGIGLVYYKKNLYQQTREYLLNFIKMYPNSKYADDAQYWVGMLHFKNKNYKKSVIAFNAAVNNYPKSVLRPESLLRLGDSYFNLKKYSSARTQYRKVVSQYPKNKNAEFALYNIGRTYDAEGAVASAVSIYTKFSEQYPSSFLSPEIMYKIAKHFSEQKNYSRAGEYYKKIYTDFPDNDLAEISSFLYAKTVYDAGNKKEAADLFKNFVTIYSNESKYYYHAVFYTGNCFMDIGEYKNAAVIYEEVLKDDAIDGELLAVMLYNCGYCYERSGQALKSEKLYNEILYRYPKSIGAGKIYLKRGLVFEKEGDIKAAIENYDMAATISKNRTIYKDDLLFQNIENGIGAEAQKRVADCYFKQKMYKEAAREYLKVVYLFSDSTFVAEAYYMAGISAEEIGLSKEAKGHYEVVKKRYPGTTWAEQSIEKLKNYSKR